MVIVESWLEAPKKNETALLFATSSRLFGSLGLSSPVPSSVPQKCPVHASGHLLRHNTVARGSRRAVRRDEGARAEVIAVGIAAAAINDTPGINGVATAVADFFNQHRGCNFVSVHHARPAGERVIDEPIGFHALRRRATDRA